MKNTVECKYMYFNQIGKMTKFCVFKYADIKLKLSTKLGEKILFLYQFEYPGGISVNPWVGE